MVQFREYDENIINTVRESLIVLDQDLSVVLASRSFYDFFKVKPEETVGQLIYDLGNKHWNINKLRELLENILPEKTSFNNYEVKHDFTTIGRRVMLLNARQIEQAMGKERIILRNVSALKKKYSNMSLNSKKNKELQDALANVKQLTGMLPICASCKQIRDDKGYWSAVESYIGKHSEAVFSHGLCLECEKKAYEDLEKLLKEDN